MPAVTPVIVPVPVIAVAIAVLLLLQVPPPVSDSDVVDPEQTDVLPDIAAGTGLTVTMFVTEHPRLLV